MLTLKPHASLQKEKGTSKRGIIFIRYRLYPEPFFALRLRSSLFLSIYTSQATLRPQFKQLATGTTCSSNAQQQMTKDKRKQL